MGDLQRNEEEMRQMFVNKVKETEAELKEKEREVRVSAESKWSPVFPHTSQAINMKSWG